MIDISDYGCRSHLEIVSAAEGYKEKVACMELTEEPVGTIKTCTIKWGTVKNGLFNSADGTPATHTYLAMDGKDWEVSEAPPIHKDFKAGQGKVCKNNMGVVDGSQYIGVDATDHATCKAACAKTAASNITLKKGKSCCSYNLSSGTGKCTLATGEDTIAEPISFYSGSSIMTDAAFEGDEVADSAIRVAMGSLVLAATTAMLSF